MGTTYRPLRLSHLSHVTTSNSPSSPQRSYDPPDEIPRSIKPRRNRHKVLPVVAIAGDEVLSEDGELITLDALIKTIPTRAPTLFATIGAADLLALFDQTFRVSHPNQWQWRISNYERTNWNPDRPSRSYRIDVAVHYFGFKQKPRVFHKLIDPVTMFRAKPAPVGDSQLERVLRWAVNIRNFCADNNLQVKPTVGGISAQFLTDSRFYPKPRRKVPALTNRRVREHLPGNHYHLDVQPSANREYSAYYLDQHRAHHHHASYLAFPHSDHLYAYGYFETLDHIHRERPSGDFHGLYCLDLEPPPRSDFAHHAYTWFKGDTKRRFVYSNELPHLYDMGYKVTGVRAAWGSHHRDTGLNLYAQWANEQLDHYQDAGWLKPLLLATYGTLACKPTTAAAIFRLASRGEQQRVPTGRRSISGKLVQRPRELEPGIANVIQRGMVEAATRSESIGFAQWLNLSHQRVLSIYADAVIVEVDDDRPLPPMPDPWRIKKTLNHLQFIHSQAFVSDNMTKLPGVGGQEARKYRQHAPGHAPRKKMYEAISGKPIQTSRRA